MNYFAFIFMGALVVLFILLTWLVSRYKKCPSDKILVIYGATGRDQSGATRSAKCIHGGAAFVVPVFQDFQYLDLTPITIDIPLKSALSRQNIRINVPSTFTVGISTEETVMNNAAERLLGIPHQQIKILAQDIIFGQLRVVIATMDIEEINADRDKFLSNVTASVEAELKKIGLKLINVNITDITDESGYIEALGKEAAAQAINEAKKTVAEKNRDGAVGEADAKQDERVRVSKANAQAVTGENEADIEIANSNAIRRQKVAEAEKRAIATEKVQAAQALEEAYAAEQRAEAARAEKDRATRNADEVVPAEIEKQKVEIAAEAEAEKRRREAKGEADAIYYKLAARAKGNLEILSKQAEGLGQIVQAAGNNPQKAAMLMIVDKLPQLVGTQVEAIKGINIDKVVVWDSMGGGTGESATANFLSGMIKSVPPLKDMFNMAGMDLPDYLGKPAPESPAEPPAKQLRPGEKPSK